MRWNARLTRLGTPNWLRWSRHALALHCLARRACCSRVHSMHFLQARAALREAEAAREEAESALAAQQQVRTCMHGKRLAFTVRAHCNAQRTSAERAELTALQAQLRKLRQEAEDVQRQLERVKASRYCPLYCCQRRRARPPPTSLCAQHGCGSGGCRARGGHVQHLGLVLHPILCGQDLGQWRGAVMGCAASTTHREPLAAMGVCCSPCECLPHVPRRPVSSCMTPDHSGAARRHRNATL